MKGRLQGQFGEVGVPGGAGALRAIEDFSVGGELENGDVGKAVGAEAFGDEFSGLVETFRTALTVEASDAFEVALGGFAGEFVGEGGDVLFGEERRFLRADDVWRDE
jgi:hypothetical protein